MNVKTALLYADASKGSQGLFERTSRVLAAELTRVVKAIAESPVQKVTLPNGTTATVALVLVDETGKVK